jgi:hypothetical protein
MFNINWFKFDCVVTDLFFPKKRGSNDRTLGIELLGRIKERLDSDKKRIAEEYHENVLKWTLPRDLPALEIAIKGEECTWKPELVPGQSSKIIVDIQHSVCGLQGREELSLRESECLKPGDKFIPSEDNQPLGILVVEKARRGYIPYVVVTAGHAGHGDISTPAAIFLFLKGWIEREESYYPGRKAAVKNKKWRPLLSDVEKNTEEAWNFIFDIVKGFE